MHLPPFSSSRPPIRLRLGILVLASLMLAGLIVSFATGSARAATVADNGFTATSDGYTFANYTEGTRDLTAQEMRYLFGNAVCSSIRNGRCTLSPEAESWMEATNEQMGGGHCFGMASTAQFFYMGIGKPPTPDVFGAPTTPELVLDDNPRLQSHIAYAWALQVLPAVQNAARLTTPTKLVERLRSELKPGDARYVLTIFDDGAGHGITPTGIEDDGNGQWRIAVYDNNWPDETRYVEVDGNANTWTYELAPGMVWSGDAETKTMGVLEPGLGLGRQPCFICPPKKGRPGSNVGKTMRLLWQGDEQRGQHGSLVVSDAKGKKSGCGPRGCVNRIPGVRMRQMMTGGVRPWRLAPPPVFELPTRKSYTVKLGATGLRGKASESVSVVGRGFSVSARGIRLRKGEADKIKIARKARRVLFVSGSRKAEKPTIEISSSNVAGGADYKIEIAPVGVNTGAGIAASFDPVDRVLLLENRRGDPIERVKLGIVEYGKQVRQFQLEEKVRRGKVKRIPLD